MQLTNIEKCLQQTDRTFVQYQPKNVVYGSTPLIHDPHFASGPSKAPQSYFTPTQASYGPSQGPQSYFTSPQGPYGPSQGPQSHVSPGPGRMQWDDHADKFSLVAHNAGKDPREIARQLILNGYSATRWDVMDSLEKQEKEKKPVLVPQAAVVVPKYRVWDKDANEFALAQHNAGQTVQQIATQLIKNGYTATRAEVASRLHNLGVQNVRLGLVPVTIHRWDGRADAFAVDANRRGQTVAQITAQLSQNGYTITAADVTASLHKQGVLGVK